MKMIKLTTSIYLICICTIDTYASAKHQIYGNVYPSKTKKVYLKKQTIHIDTNEIENAIQNAEQIFQEIDKANTYDLIYKFTFDENTFKLAKQTVKNTKRILEEMNQQNNIQNAEKITCSLKLFDIWLSLSHAEKYIGTSQTIYRGPTDILTRPKRALTKQEFEKEWKEIKNEQDKTEKFRRLDNIKKQIGGLRNKIKVTSIAKIIFPGYNPRNSQIIAIKEKIIREINQRMLRITQSIARDRKNGQNRSPSPPTRPPTPPPTPATQPATRSPSPPTRPPTPPTRPPSPPTQSLTPPPTLAMVNSPDRSTLTNNEDDTIGEFEPVTHSTPEIRDKSQETEIEISLRNHKLTDTDPIFMSDTSNGDDFEFPRLEFDDEFVIIDREYRTRRQTTASPTIAPDNPVLELSKRVSTLGINYGINNVYNSFNTLLIHLKEPSKHFLRNQCNDLTIDQLVNTENSLTALSEEIVASTLENVQFCGDSYCFRLSNDVSNILIDKNSNYCHSTEIVGTFLHCKKWTNKIYPCTFSLQTENCHFELVDNLDNDLQIETYEHLLNDNSAVLNTSTNVIFQNGIRKDTEYMGYTLNKAISTPYGINNISFFLDSEQIDKNFENLVGPLYHIIHEIQQYFHEWIIFKYVVYGLSSISLCIGLCYIFYMKCWKVDKKHRPVRTNRNRCVEDVCESAF